MLWFAGCIFYSPTCLELPALALQHDVTIMPRRLPYAQAQATSTRGNANCAHGRSWSPAAMAHGTCAVARAHHTSTSSQPAPARRGRGGTCDRPEVDRARLPHRQDGSRVLSHQPAQRRGPGHLTILSGGACRRGNGGQPVLRLRAHGALLSFVGRGGRRLLWLMLVDSAGGQQLQVHGPGHYPLHRQQCGDPAVQGAV